MNPLLILLKSKDTNIQIKTGEIEKLLFSHKIKYSKINVEYLDSTNNKMIIANI